MGSPADDRLRQLVKAIDRYMPKRRTEEGWRKYRQPLNDYSAEMRGRIKVDTHARDALDFLEGKARKKAAKEGKVPPRDVLQDILAVLPLEYRTPPARGRRGEIGRQERLAVKLRDAAKTVREDLGRAWRIVPPDYYAPRKSKGSLEQIPDCPILLSRPELEPLPEMLEQYAALVEKRADLLRQCAKREPTEKQWWDDAEARVIEYIRRSTGMVYREKVVSILMASRPSLHKPNFADKAETLRKRDYRQRKSHPA